MTENMGVFRHFALPLSEIAPVQAKVKNLKNTVWKTPFGTLWQRGKSSPSAVFFGGGGWELHDHKLL